MSKQELIRLVELLKKYNKAMSLDDLPLHVDDREFLLGQSRAIISDLKAQIEFLEVYYEYDRSRK